ncbi:tyrosine-protein phosphatase [Actinomadura sp. 21ATH]|uniref:tyrosine-protein phosphatase n=1 Tax=Actinomadura sp. 21ATH TaxID=1735444 RepID=UPI0035C252DE
MQREIVLEGCVNFRDLGGYGAEGGRVRWRRLFRSDALHELTAADVAALREIGLATVIDLRSDFERRHDGGGPHPLAGIAEIVEAPVIDRHNAEIMADTSLSLARRYARIMESSGTALVDAAGAIAAARGAAVFHCAAGKDRTGMLSAVVLGAIGVADEDVIADYAMTGRNLARIEARLAGNPAYERTAAYVPRDVMTADAATMGELIADLRARHGGMAGLLGSLGAPEDVAVRLRAALVEPVAP